VGLAISGYSPEEENTTQRKILDRVSALPGVTLASLTDWIPLSFNGKTADAYPEGYAPQLHEPHEVRRADVSSGYFTTMGMQMVEGRDFTREDDESAPRVVIVDETAAWHYWRGLDPLGRHLIIWGHPYTVIGVVKNSKHQFLSEQPEPMVYLSFFQNHDETTVQVRTSGNPSWVGPAVENAIHGVDGQLAVFDVRTLRETTHVTNSFAVMESTFASIFALLAIVLATTGIYGVVAYRTAMRTHEIGIRVALGASRTDVLRLVLRQGVVLTAAGLALGLALALCLTRFLAGQLYGVGATDSLTVLCVTLLLAGAAILACYLPARKATRVQPVIAIHTL
jgi:predicted permease